MRNWIAELWCKTMHTRAMWPIHGRYICPDCLREYRVSWEDEVETVTLAKPATVASRAVVP